MGDVSTNTNQLNTMPEKPIVMNICEAEHIVLRVGVPYLFEADPNCKRCCELRDIYSIDTKTSDC